MPLTPRPDYSRSKFILDAKFDKLRHHKGDGDMWPITWAEDGHCYGGAGDNLGSPMNFWRIEGAWLGPGMHLVHPLPVDPARYCPSNSIKPAGLLHFDGVMYFAVECMNYGDSPDFNRQHNLNGWIVTSRDYGKTWDPEATPTDFFTGRVASCHFIQCGRGRDNIRDGYVYANFPGVGDDGESYWENGDYILLGRVPAEGLLDRAAWEFWCEASSEGSARWSKDDADAQAIFRYPRMTGEDHITYNPGLGRYLLGNYGFLDEEGRPRPYHQLPWPQSVWRSQLTLFEAPRPWGPWSLFHLDDDWGTYGDYQPCFSPKFMNEDGTDMILLSSGTFDDYNLTTQRLTATVAR